MALRGRTDGRLPIALVLLCGAAFGLAGCSTSEPTAGIQRTKTSEYFSEKEYGVKASPRVTAKRAKLPRGGGRDQIGKPYKIKGKWYRPQEDPDYRKVGAASWYGDAFHGRLTANGEIYDMTHLTAAHPTMPLPSYARVTNLKNGNSVIVRVNDRGPFANNRIIDLSKRAAEMLDYKHSGVAKVEVAYLGRAPLHGQDDAFLLASYRPGGAAPDASDGLPAGVMVAMNGPTPTHNAPAFPVTLASTGAAGFPEAPRPAEAHVAPGDPQLPDYGPIVPERPASGLMVRHATDADFEALAYADRRVSRAAAALEAFATERMTPQAVAASWRRVNGDGAPASPAAAPPIAAPSEYVAAGTFATRGAAVAMAASLSDVGLPAIGADGGVFALSIFPDGRAKVDDILRAAWQAGAGDAMTVRPSH